MIHSFLLASDLHLTDSPWDEYRWGLFDWMVEQQAKYDINSLYILGDLTDEKDNHSAVLVNRVADSIRKVADCYKNIGILMGNHDFLLKGHPFFKFLQYVGDGDVAYIDEPHCDTFGDESMLFLPYAKDPSPYWEEFNLSEYQLVFMHQTVSGALASNGMKMEGIKVPFARGTKIWSGDIHVPQMIGNVEYVGSPYHVHFGDRFEPRCIMRDEDGQYYNLTYPTLSKFSTKVRSADELRALELVAGDQLKLKVVLAREDLGRWNEIRQSVMDEAQLLGIAVRGIELVVDKPPVARVKLRKRGEVSPVMVSASGDVLNAFASLEKLGQELVEEGTSIVHEDN